MTDNFLFLQKSSLIAWNALKESDMGSSDYRAYAARMRELAKRLKNESVKAEWLKRADMYLNIGISLEKLEKVKS